MIEILNRSGSFIIKASLTADLAHGASLSCYYDVCTFYVGLKVCNRKHMICFCRIANHHVR